MEDQRGDTDSFNRRRLERLSKNMLEQAEIVDALLRSHPDEKQRVREHANLLIEYAEQVVESI